MKTFTAFFFTVVLLAGCFKGQPVTEALQQAISHGAQSGEQQQNVDQGTQQNDALKTAIVITKPTKGQILSQAAQFTAKVVNQTAGLEIRFFLNGKLAGQVKSQPYHTVIDTKAYQDGPLIFRIEAYDGTKFIAYDEVIANLQNTVLVQDPAVVLTGIKTGDTVTEKVSIKADWVNLPADAEVHFKINGVVMGTDTQFPYEYVLNPQDYPDGKIVVTVEAYQAGQLIAQTQAELNIKKPAAVDKPVVTDNGAVNLVNNDGTYKGAIVGAGSDAGLTGNALLFNGKDTYLAIPTSEDLDLTQAGTIEAWIYPESFQANAGIIHKGEKSDFSDEAYSLQFWDKNKQLALVLKNENGEKIELLAEKVIENGFWAHVAATWDANTIKLFVNGKKVMEKQNTIGRIKKSAGDLLIGARTKELVSNRFRYFAFDGLLDKIGVYKQALAENVIAEHYNQLKK